MRRNKKNCLSISFAFSSSGANGPGWPSPHGGTPKEAKFPAMGQSSPGRQSWPDRNFDKVGKKSRVQHVESEDINIVHGRCKISIQKKKNQQKKSGTRKKKALRKPRNK